MNQSSYQVTFNHTNSNEFNELKRQVTNLTTFLKATNKNVADIGRKIAELKVVASASQPSKELFSQV